jgi:putative chitinase
MKLASLPRELWRAPQPRDVNQPPSGGFFYGESMTDFSTALTRLWPHSDEKIPGLRAGMIASAPAVFARYGITTPLPVAHVMAQGSHECGAGLEPAENLSYSAERMTQVWPSRFPTPGSAEPYAHNPRALADKVYNGRMGNRPGTDDGFNFRGQGFSQTTGRDEYERLGKLTGLDLVNHPELLIDPAHFLECGVANFVLCGCLPFAKADDVVNVTRRLNGGTVGLDQRRQWLAKWKAELGDTPIVLGPAGPRVTLPTTPRPLPPDAPKPAAPAATPSITNPAKGSIGAFIASILAAIFRRKG